MPDRFVFIAAYSEQRVIDNAVSEVSPDGKLLYRESFSRILIRNGLTALLPGHSVEKFLNDLIHMNQISPALSSPDLLAERRSVDQCENT